MLPQGYKTTRIVKNELNIKLDHWVYNESCYCGLWGFHHRSQREPGDTDCDGERRGVYREKDGRGDVLVYWPQFCTSDSWAKLSLHAWSPIFKMKGMKKIGGIQALFLNREILQGMPIYKSRAVECNWYMHITYLNVHLLIQIIIWLYINHLLKLGVMKERGSFISTLIIWFVFNFCFHGKTRKFSQTSTCKW